MGAIALGIIGQLVIPSAAAAVSIAVGLGVKWLKRKVQFEEGKQALDALDQIVQTTVGNIAQTTAKEMKRTTKKANLTGSQKTSLKLIALKDVKAIASAELQRAATRTLDDLDGYIGRKIEDSVLKLGG